MVKKLFIPMLFCVLLIASSSPAKAQQGPENFLRFHGKVLEEGHPLARYHVYGKVETWAEGDPAKQVNNARITLREPRVKGIKRQQRDRFVFNDRWASISVQDNVVRVSWGLFDPAESPEDMATEDKEVLSVITLAITYPVGWPIDLTQPLPAEYESAVLVGPGFSFICKPGYMNPTGGVVLDMMSDIFYD